MNKHHSTDLAFGRPARPAFFVTGRCSEEGPTSLAETLERDRASDKVSASGTAPASGEPSSRTLSRILAAPAFLTIAQGAGGIGAMS